MKQAIYSVLSKGHQLLEAPVWEPDLGLLYTDAHVGGIWRFREGNTPEAVVAHRRGIGGLARHADGGYVVSGRNVAWKAAIGDEQDATVVYLESDPGQGRTGYNDLVADESGRIYVGSLAYVPMLGQTGSGQTGQLHLIDESGEARVVADGIRLSNGLGFSPDGRHLYHADSDQQVVFRYRVSADGSLDERMAFARATSGRPDGLAVAEDGSVWVAMVGGGEVVQFAVDGSVRQRISLPVPMITSVCFGGSEWKDLYVVSGAEGAPPDLGGCIFRIPVDVPGRRRPLARVARIQRAG